MARQRFIWPDIWKDPVFGKLDPFEQVMFIGLFSIADDDGRLLADPAFLRAELFPYKDFTAKKVQNIRDTVAAKCANVHLYEVEGVEYVALLKWSEYQRPKYPKPSKIPPPFPQGSPNASPELEAEVETPNLRAGQGWAGLDRDGQGRVDETPVAEERAAVEREFGLPISAEKLLELRRITSSVKDADDGSLRVLEKAASGLSLGAIVKVRESVELRSPRVGVGYAVEALRSEREEAVA